MAKFMVAVSNVSKVNGKEEIGDILRAWTYDDFSEARKQYGRVIAGLKRHKKIRYNVELPKKTFMAQTESDDGGRSLWITLTEEKEGAE